MKKLLMFAAISLLAACTEKNGNVDLHAKIAALEARVNLLEASANEQANFVLWQTTEWNDKNRMNIFGSPKTLSAFNTKEDCMKAANEWTLPRARILSADPRMITDGSTTVTYSCLPSSMNLRKN